MAPSDTLDRVMAIMDAAFDPMWGEAWTRRQVEDAMLLGNSHCVLVSADGELCPEEEQPVGFCLSRHMAGDEELLLFAVLPEHRNRGLGRRLLALMFEHARCRGAQRLLLEMRANNPAEALYRDCGFRQIGLRPRYYRTLLGERIDAKTFCFDL